MKKADRIPLKEKYEDVPHVDIIEENGKITIPSVFMFTEGNGELFRFLEVCREAKCNVRFENENVTVLWDQRDLTVNLMLTIYMTIMEKPAIAMDYFNFLTNQKNMLWENVIKEQEKQE